MSSSSIFASLGAALHTPLFSFKAFTPASKANPALSTFEADLSAKLDGLKLISFNHDADNAPSLLSMPWLCHAMQVVLWTHTSAETFVPELKQALLHGDTKWLNAYLDDSTKLLDTCNALREAIKEIRSYHAHVKLALHALDNAHIGEAQLRRTRIALSACVDALQRRGEECTPIGSIRKSKLDSCSSMLKRMGEKLNMEDPCKGDFFKVSHAAQVTTVFICGVLTATLSLKPRRPLSMIAIARQFSWAYTLTSLQQRLKEQIERQKTKGAEALLQELSMTNTAVHSLKVRVEKLLKIKKFPMKSVCMSDVKRHAESLRTCSIQMENGLNLLHQHVEDVVKILVTSRMLLLDIYSSHHVKSSNKLPYREGREV